MHIGPVLLDCEYNFFIQYANLSGKYLVKAPRCLIHGVVEDVRTIFMRQNQYIYIPDLSDFENRQTNEMVGYFVLPCSRRDQE